MGESHSAYKVSLKVSRQSRLDTFCLGNGIGNFKPGVAIQQRHSRAGTRGVTR